MTHQAQVTRRSLSYEAVFFSSLAVPEETFHFDKRFVIVWDKGPAEGLYDKDPSPFPPYTHNLTTLPSAPGDPIKAGVFNASNREEYIDLGSNKGMENDYDMKPDHYNVPSVGTHADEKLFEG